MLSLRLPRESLRRGSRALQGLSRAHEGAWLCIVVSSRPPRSARACGARLRRPDDIIALVDDDEDALAVVLAPEDRRAGLASLAPLVEQLSAPASSFVALVARRAPPRHDFRFDGSVASFACGARVLAAHAAALRRPETLCFHVLRGAITGRPSVECLLVRQIPLRRPAAPPRPAPVTGHASAVDVLLPHRGSPALLAAALRSIACGEASAKVLVGLDSRGTAAYRSLISRYPAVEFFQSEPAPLGPYAVRHALALRARAPYLLFHDSDDVSCRDRIDRLQQAMLGTRAGLVGSHELRLDEICECVTAVRFPIDVNAALRVNPHHPMLFPSTLMLRESYLEVGGLSTDRTFAYDTQFVFRCSFALRIANVDEFLYIRRRREGSLTTAPATALGTPVRVELLTSWMRDFRSVKAGRMAIDKSSLRVMPRREPYRLASLATGRASHRRSPWVVAHSDRSR